MIKIKITNDGVFVKLDFSSIGLIKEDWVRLDQKAKYKNMSVEYSGDIMFITITEPNDKVEDILSGKKSRTLYKRKKEPKKIERIIDVFHLENIYKRLTLHKKNLKPPNKLVFQKEKLEEKNLKIGQIYGFVNFGGTKILHATYIRPNLTYSIKSDLVKEIFTKDLEKCILVFSKYSVTRDKWGKLLVNITKGVKESNICIDNRSIQEINEQLKKDQLESTELMRDE